MNAPKGPGLDFEQPLLALDRKIDEIRTFANEAGIDLHAEIARLGGKRAQLLERIRARLTPWNRIELARRSGRPLADDFLAGIFTDLQEFHGDRAQGDDAAVFAGLGRLEGRPVGILAHRKGADTRQNIARNFGMPHPEGYRKARRLIDLAARFRRPLVCLVDTPGAFPGIEAEERGQAQAIAENILALTEVPVPVVVLVIGEGASGGALGIGVGDRLLMFENTWYCVISPEGCAAILWGDRARARELAGPMRLTPHDLLTSGLVDRVLPEPPGGAHWDPARTVAICRQALAEELAELSRMPLGQLLDRRALRMAATGPLIEETVPSKESP